MPNRSNINQNRGGQPSRLRHILWRRELYEELESGESVTIPDAVVANATPGETENRNQVIDLTLEDPAPIIDLTGDEEPPVIVDLTFSYTPGPAPDSARCTPVALSYSPGPSYSPIPSLLSPHTPVQHNFQPRRLIFPDASNSPVPSEASTVNLSSLQSLSPWRPPSGFWGNGEPESEEDYRPPEYVDEYLQGDYRIVGDDNNAVEEEEEFPFEDWVPGGMNRDSPSDDLLDELDTPSGEPVPEEYYTIQFQYFQFREE